MRKNWREKFLEIDHLLSKFNDSGRVRKTDEQAIEDLREAVHRLTNLVYVIAENVDGGGRGLGARGD